MRRSHFAWGVALACVLPAGALPAGARAATFDVLRTAPDSVTILDRQSIETIGDGQIRRASTVNVQKSLVSGGPRQSGSVRTSNEYDCAERRIRVRSFSVYSRFGDLILRNDTPDPNWTPVDASFEATAGTNLVCNGKGPNNAYSAASLGQLVITLMQAWDEPAPPVAPASPDKAPRPKGKDKPAARR